MGSPTREYGPCPKCGGNDILVQFHDGQRHCEWCRRDRIDPPSCRYSDDLCKPWFDREHLRVHCRRCQHGWVEQPGVAILEPNIEETQLDGTAYRVKENA